MYGYAILLALKRAFNFEAVLDPSALEALDFYFENAKEIPGWGKICIDSYPWINFMSRPALLNESLIGEAFEIPEKVRIE